MPTSDQYKTPLRCLPERAAEVASVEQFKRWIREDVRQLLPHGALACGHGRVNAAGVSMDYVITVDYPVDHLAAIRNTAGGIDTPIMRRWFETRSPVLFEADSPWPGVPAPWLANFRRHRLLNALAHACYDRERCIGTYFSFHRLPPSPGQAQRTILSEIMPLLHEVLMRVIAQVETGAGEWPELTEREREVARQIAAGGSNHDVARTLGLSENTVKHHVTKILGKTGLPNRAGLASRVATCGMNGSTRLL